MRFGALLRESLLAVWSAKVPSALIVVVTAAMSFVALTTVGQTAANEAAVQSQLESAGARILSITDTNNAGFINQRTISQVQRLSTVDSALGIGAPFDAVNGRVGAGGPKVTVWPLRGDLPAGLSMTIGRWPRPGEAVISTEGATRLGLLAPIGYLETDQGSQYPIVGAFRPVAPFADFQGAAVVNATDDTATQELKVVITDLPAVQATQRSVLGILAPPDPQSLRLESPSGLARLTQTVGGQLDDYGRVILLLVLGAGGVFVSSVVLSDVLIRRRDLGRRRTLGATRSAVVLLVTLRALIPATAGALMGAAVSFALLGVNAGPVIPADFAVAVWVLTVAAAGASAVPPALYAAMRDPVQVMRTP